MINQVFYCFLPENIVTKPNKVVVRIVDYEKLKEAYDYTSVLALSVVLSQKGISPKILGSFQYGTISEYIEVVNNNYTWREFNYFLRREDT